MSEKGTTFASGGAIAVAVVAVAGVIAYFAFDRTPSQLPSSESPQTTEGAPDTPEQKTAVPEASTSEPVVAETTASEAGDPSPDTAVDAGRHQQDSKADAPETPSEAKNAA